MMGSFSVIAILISCLGLLGLITYSVGQKAKEIGIRKIIGAGVGDTYICVWGRLRGDAGDPECEDDQGGIGESGAGFAERVNEWLLPYR
jgi:hypothetical protein